MAAAASLVFKIGEILFTDGAKTAQSYAIPNFIKISHFDAEILQFNDFSRWRPSTILDLFAAYLDNPRRVLGGFGYDLCSSFDTINVSIFGTFGWKTPIHAPKIGILGQFDPLNGLQYQPKRIKHTLV